MKLGFQETSLIAIVALPVAIRDVSSRRGILQGDASVLPVIAQVSLCIVRISIENGNT